ncbi:hypothetical protein F5144DRAFT_631183 [Chaetomium tenue]|uniref:Uncharacterized protein n=1 Tax=Chaetomium tenue TaxID=1854479 RepID=A0ACB7P1R5_9PEZI|nr:hypothetical protein F5144DRAFT_631183 [Chaetomium globosum]
MDVFRFFRPSGEPKEDRIGKRRAQVRRAQQTYRLRKDLYTKSLENEISRLRTVETDLLRETQHLNGTIQTLENLLADRGVNVDLHVPSDSASEGRPTWPSTPLAANHFIAEQPQGAQLGVPQALPADDRASFWPELWQEPRPTNGGGISLGYATPSPSDRQVAAVPAVPSCAPSCVPSHHKPRHDDVDAATTMGMDLEAPCLPHLHGDPTNPDQPCGHALTVSSQLLAISSPTQPTSPLPSTTHPPPPSPLWPSPPPPPLCPPSPPSPKTLHDACARTPASILDRLLTLSAGLDVAPDEVTPVRAWQRVRALPGFERLGGEGVRVLMARLGGVVKCHGFGAVVKEAVFENLMREVFAERRRKF